jgi:hypothetical protein
VLAHGHAACKAFVALIAGIRLFALVHVADVIFEIAANLGLVGTSSKS